MSTDVVRNLAWKLNWYRQSELEGALLLGRMVRHAGEPFLVWHLTRHCADEARHAWLWERTLTALDLPTIRIDRQKCWASRISSSSASTGNSRKSSRIPIYPRPCGAPSTR